MPSAVVLLTKTLSQVFLETFFHWYLCNHRYKVVSSMKMLWKEHTKKINISESGQKPVIQIRFTNQSTAGHLNKNNQNMLKNKFTWWKKLLENNDPCLDHLEAQTRPQKTRLCIRDIFRECWKPNLQIVAESTQICDPNVYNENGMLRHRNSSMRAVFNCNPFFCPI